MIDQERQYFAVMPAAGVGVRSGLNGPKQFHTLKNRTVIEHALEALLAHPKIKTVVVVLTLPNPDWDKLSIASHPKITTVLGGAQRMDSVVNGLQALTSIAQPDDWVLVHDAARPCLTQGMIDKLIAELQHHPVGGLLAVPVRDTLKRADESGHIIETQPRDHLFQAQTPQMCRFQPLHRALQSAQASGAVVTDEAHSLELMGYAPKLVMGSHRNIKLTYPEDFTMLESCLLNEDER